jgi:glycosyltransferase involved in cell wall biosynthesis
MSGLRWCAVVPTYDNPETVRDVVERIRAHLPDVFVVDDGSATPGQEVCRAIERDGLARVFRREKNGGKGAAVKRGLAEAAEAGFTHVFQIDADGQHGLDAIPDFLAASRRSPSHAIFGAPIYDETVPSIRRVGRKITRFWVDLEVGRGVIEDTMVGFRIYPVAQTLAVAPRTNRMAFDVEVAVGLAWAGVPIENLPVEVRYLTADEGGRSHFRPFLDNLLLSWLHTRLCTTGSIRWCLRLVPRRSLPGRS